MRVTKQNIIDTCNDYGININAIPTELRSGVKSMIKDLIKQKANSEATKTGIEGVIRPYDFVKLKDGNYVFVRMIQQRRVDTEMYLPDKIVDGVLVDKSHFITEGPSTKTEINIQTVKSQELIKILNRIHTVDNYWCYIGDIEQHIPREAVTFKLQKKRSVA